MFGFAGEFDQPTFEPERAGARSHAMIVEPCCFDGALPTEAARIKNIESNVVGQADLLLMPQLNAGKMLYGNSNCVGGGDCTRLVPGARVQIVLTSRTDLPPSRVASAMLAQRGSGADR